MVLEEVEQTAPESFVDDSSPASDSDPYQEGSVRYGADVEMRVNLSQLPSPPPIIGPLLGFSQRKQMKAITDSIKGAQTILKRPATQEEVDAISYYASKSVAAAAYGSTIGLGAGIYRAIQTRATQRFPFFKPEPETVERILRGNPLRRLFFTGFRGGFYAALGMLIGGMLGNSYGAATAAVGFQRDPRTKSFFEALDNLRRERMELPEARQARQQQNGPSSQASTRTSYGDRRDDMSPTSESSPFGADTSALSDEQMRQQEIGQQADPRTSPTSNRSSTFRMNKVTAQPHSQDDASPTGGAGMLDSLSPSSSTPNTGNAWDRLRQNANTGRSNDQSGSRARETSGRTFGVQREQQQGSTLGDSFSFSATEEERQLAKSEAQKEFDARVDRERQGRDFAADEGSRGRKW